MSEEEINAVGEPDAWMLVFDEKQHAVLHLADAMVGETNALPAELISELQQHFSEEELAELILIGGQANLNNRAGNVAKQLLGERS